MNNFRSIAAVPLKALVTLYVVALPLSLPTAEVLGWLSCIALALYVIADRWTAKHELEIHTVGIEPTLIAFFFVIFIGLRVNSPSTDWVSIYFSLSRILLIFVIAYSLQVVKNLNRLFAGLIFFGTLASAYGIFQHFSGIDFLRQGLAVETIPWGDGQIPVAMGLFSNHDTYAHAFTMLIGVPWAALLLSRRSAWWQTALYCLSFLIILVSLVFAFTRGAWLSVLVTLPLMAFFVSRKVFFATVGVSLLCGGLAYEISPNVHRQAPEIFAERSPFNDQRKNLWHINIEMFDDHPWVGVGYLQNEPLSQTYYDKLGIKDGVNSDAHSTYVQLLSTTGLLGFAFYMFTIIIFVLMTARLYSIIPTTHYWHKVFALSALGAQIAFHIGGLTHWSFRDPELQHVFFFWLAVVAYMTQRYFVHIVPDDHSL